VSRRLYPIAAALAAVVALSSCTGTTPGGDDAKKAGAKADAPEISVTAPDKTIKAGGKLKLSVANGKFQKVEVTDADHSSAPADTGVMNPKTKSTATATETAKAGGNLALTSTDQTTAATDPTDTSDAESSAATDDSGSLSDTQASAEPTEQGTTWSSKYGLAGSSTYNWKATVVDDNGNTQEKTGTVKTAKPKGEATGINPIISDGQTVGVGAPILLYFNTIVTDKNKAAVESRLKVTATDKDGKKRNVEGTWAWLPVEDGISRLNYRPKEYWPAHTNVKVELPLKNVQYAANRFGKKDVNFSFKVGREQIATGNAKTHRFKVERNGKEIWNWPASLGRPAAPSYNGVHVVMSKHANYTMKSERWNYTTPTQWSVRIQNNGEFVHAAPWSEGSQGSANVSHGCINLSNSRAYKYYKSALYGDPVIIKGSSVKLSKSNSDVIDWVYDWDEYKEMSAL
jgi:lipoprotein-anchoring transpeptidase ErfK/SrfK